MTGVDTNVLVRYIVHALIAETNRRLGSHRSPSLKRAQRSHERSLEFVIKLA